MEAISVFERIERLQTKCEKGTLIEPAKRPFAKNRHPRQTNSMTVKRLRVSHVTNGLLFFHQFIQDIQYQRNDSKKPVKGTGEMTNGNAESLNEAISNGIQFHPCLQFSRRL